MINLEMKERISRLIGHEAKNFRRASGGYSPAERWLFSAGERSYFAKSGTNTWTNQQLAQEISAYRMINGPFMPEVVATDDDPDAPLLILEDLSHAFWPPPWTRNQIDRVLKTLELIHGTSTDLPSYEDIDGQPAPSWAIVAENPEPFLSLDLVSSSWLHRALPILLQAESRCRLSGTALTHWDIRSDNLCLDGTRVKLIDWNGACLGNPKLDLGFWLPSLEFEGGPKPETIIGAEPEIAAFVAAYFAARAGLPVIVNAPHVRTVQRQQLIPALSWAQRALALPELDGGQQ